MKRVSRRKVLKFARLFGNPNDIVSIAVESNVVTVTYAVRDERGRFVVDANGTAIAKRTETFYAE